MDVYVDPDDLRKLPCPLSCGQGGMAYCEHPNRPETFSVCRKRWDVRAAPEWCPLRKDRIFNVTAVTVEKT